MPRERSVLLLVSAGLCGVAILAGRTEQSRAVPGESPASDRQAEPRRLKSAAPSNTAGPAAVDDPANRYGGANPVTQPERALLRNSVASPLRVPLLSEQCSPRRGRPLPYGRGSDTFVVSSLRDFSGTFDRRSIVVTSPGQEAPAIRFSASPSDAARQDPPPCPSDSLFGQPPVTPDAFTAVASEESVGVRYLDNFIGVPGAIDAVTFWGLELTFDGQNFSECNEPNTVFEISFFEKTGDLPGPLVVSHTLNVTRTPTGMLYGGFELNEYTVTLPEPLVLVHGWISIVGKGDPNCLFFWMEGVPVLGGVSYCDGCDTAFQPFDLSYCLQGTAGGILGACCNQAAGFCDNLVDIANCTAFDERFVQGGRCETLDPPCTVVTGPCCKADFSCDFLTESDCVFAGVFWPGPTFDCNACPDPLPCPGDSLFSQLAQGPEGFNSNASEVSAGFARAESFSGVSGPIDSLTWWGFDLDFLGGSSFAECDEPNNVFDIVFYEDAGGVPGDVVCSYQVLATRTPTGILYLGAELNEYSVTLPQPCVLVNGWVSIVGRGDPECWFFWINALSGDALSFCFGCPTPVDNLDFAVCLQGTPGGVFGACCNDATGDCTNNVEIDDCTAPGLRFAPNQSCTSLDPACGVIVGACCFDDGTCQEDVQEPNCVSQGGTWLGANTICSSCPCVVPPTPGCTPEGEVTCFDGYVDTFNGGCTAATPTFQSINIGDVICGDSGIFFSGEEVFGDFDWFEVSVTAPTELTWTAEAEFSPQIWIIDSTGGCPGTALAMNAHFQCNVVSVSANVGAGTYWVLIGPLNANDEDLCGDTYVAALSATDTCPGDTDGDADVDLDDLTVLLQQFGSTGVGFAGDVDRNGRVDLDDLTLLLQNFGALCA